MIIIYKHMIIRTLMQKNVLHSWLQLQLRNVWFGICVCISFSLSLSLSFFLWCMLQAEGRKCQGCDRLHRATCIKSLTAADFRTCDVPENTCFFYSVDTRRVCIDVPACVYPMYPSPLLYDTCTSHVQPIFTASGYAPYRIIPHYTIEKKKWPNNSATMNDLFASTRYARFFRSFN